MKKITKASKCVVGASIALSCISQAIAQDNETPKSKATNKPISMEEIVVSARRTEERLIDVPQTVNVVTGENIEKLRITNLADISQVVSGISIQNSSSGSGPQGSSSSVRGVPTFLLSGANPIVQFYLNDAPTGRGPGAMSSMFDVGQIEVLKGPQGTLRGRSAPTGAITVTTKQPDFNEAGGYINASATDRNSTNIQGAIGVPLIQDVLAVRLAGVTDDTDGNGVESVHNGKAPSSDNDTFRITLNFQPTDNLFTSLMYQKSDTDQLSYPHLEGLGNGVNGPSIDAEDRLGITDQPNTSSNIDELYIARLDWSVSDDNTISYVGSYRDSKTSHVTANDDANVIAGADYTQNVQQDAEEWTHEIRFSSDDLFDGKVDYAVGAFASREEGKPFVTGNARFLSGAFGSPFSSPVPSTPNSRYTLPTLISIDFYTEEVSFFANANIELTDNTELSIGGRYITFERSDDFSLDLGSAYFSLGAPCSVLPPSITGVEDSPVYPGACDIPVDGFTIQQLDHEQKEDPFIYNLSLSHDFSEDLMGYISVGTAFRTASTTIGIQTAPCCDPPSTVSIDPITDLIFQEPEDSITYEIGFKSSLFEDRLKFSVAAFYQEFDNFYYLTQPTRYLSITDPSNPAAATVSSFEFTTTADADVKGFELEAAYLITQNWSASANFTWSRAELKGGDVPCNDGNFDGVPDTIVPSAQDFFDAGVAVARCSSEESISRSPLWNLTMQSEYNFMITQGMEGFVRGNYVYYPDNKNASEGIVIDSYGLLNLFAGLRSSDSNWEVFAFVKNVTNESQLLSKNPLEVTSAANPEEFFPTSSSGYYDVSYTPRREVGINVRYAFGSH